MTWLMSLIIVDLARGTRMRESDDALMSLSNVSLLNFTTFIPTYIYNLTPRAECLHSLHVHCIGAKFVCLSQVTARTFQSHTVWHSEPHPYLELFGTDPWLALLRVTNSSPTHPLNKYLILRDEKTSRL